MIAEYLKVFFVGAALCMIGQVLIDKTRLTPARILTLYVVAGVALALPGSMSRLRVGQARVRVCR